MSNVEDTTPVTKRDLIEQKLDKIFPEPPRGNIVSGAFTPTDLGNILDFAKTMGTSSLIGEHLRGNPGDCAFIVSKSLHHRLEPYSLASMSYAVRGRMEFKAQFSVALIHSSGLLKERLRYSYSGEGEARQCVCSGHFKGEATPLTYETPPIAKISPKQSPLWATDPDQQLSYYAARAWGRRHCPEVLAGFHFEGEDYERPGNQAKDITPAAALHNRLAAAQANGGTGEGFRPGNVEDALSSRTETAPAAAEPAGEAPEPPPAPKTRQRPSQAEPEAKAKKPAKAPKPPKTAAEYREHVRHWLMDVTTEQDIEARWRSEMRLRNSCHVTEEVKAEIRTGFVDPRIQELRK